jgi:hypothetical protein
MCVCVRALMSFSICYPACVFHIQHVCRSAECAGVSCCSFDVCVCVHALRLWLSTIVVPIYARLFEHPAFVFVLSRMIVVFHSGP